VICAISLLYVWNVVANIEYGEIGWIWIMRSCSWNRISREIQKRMLVCVRMWGIRIGWYPETQIIIHAQIEQNGLCREE